MTDVFLRLVGSSLSAGWLVLAILGLRLLLRRWPRRLFPCLWGLVGLRLLLPVSIFSRFSLIPRISDFYSQAAWEAGTGNYAGGLFPAISWTWAIGTAALLLFGLLSFLLLRRKLRTAVRLEGRVYQSEYVQSPFILGIFSPRIFLPFHLSKADASHVIAHEEAHLRRRDHWWKPLAYVVLCVYWFHPLLWLAYCLLCRDIELACDERVVRNMAEPERAAYAQTLLTCTANRFPVPSCPLSFGSSGINGRIHSVLSYHKPRRWVPLATAALMLVLSLCFLTDPASPEAADTAPPLQRQLSASERAEKPSSTHAQSPAPEAPDEALQARMDAEVQMIAERIIQQEQQMAEMQARADQLIAEKFPAMKWPENCLVLSEEQAQHGPICDLYPGYMDAEYVFMVTEEGSLLMIRYNEKAPTSACP